MSSNRLSYDPSAYESEIKRSTGPLDYAISPYFASNCNRCLPDVTTSHPRNNTPNTTSKIDVENSLTSRTWKRDRRQPGGMRQDDFEQLAIRYEDNIESCPVNSQETTHSLLTDPKSRYRGLSTEHLVFSALPIDPQTYIPVVGDQGINSRKVAIDSYRKITGGVCKGSKCKPKETDKWPFTDAEESQYAPV